MVHFVEVILNDPVLIRGVTEALASAYCPTNQSSFLLELVALIAFFCIIGIVLQRFGRVPRIVGVMFVVFAIGIGAIDFFGLSGCNGHIEKGLTWDQPW